MLYLVPLHLELQFRTNYFRLYKTPKQLDLMSKC
ncbi:unnamed protein product [Rhodiola kirilowii]